MSTKYSFIEHSFTTTENRNYNFNLNQYKKCPILVPVHSYSKSNNDKYCGTASTDFIVSDDYEEKEKLQSWNKSSKASTFTTLNGENNKKRWKNGNILNITNKSTLSLYIAAYKNSNEAVATDLLDDENIVGLKKDKLGSIKTYCFTDRLMNPFESPRQQKENQRSKPEVMQFKTSQRLLGSQPPTTSQQIGTNGEQIPPGIGTAGMTSWFFVHSKQALSIRKHNKSRQFIFADSFFGLVLCFFLMSIEWAPLLWNSLLTSVQYMEQLLGWIQETPAGLKLNSQLSYVLSSFFKYHLHLCRTYVLSWSIHPIRYLPLLAPFVGATVFMGIFVDILALITIHLRCFHLYGHRLASLSWTAIRSTFYAFQEKKWNPLRHRVDYVHLDFRQRLFATLEFLFLVALLPTIAVYCLVFSGLFIVFDSICKLLVYGVKIFQQTFLKSQKLVEEK